VQNLLFDTPWWLLTLIGVVGIALFMAGNSRQNKPLLRSGLVVLLLGIVLAVVSYLVDTPREKVIKGTHALVQAAVNKDKNALATYLHPNASLGGWNRQQIIDGAVVYVDRFGLKSATITGMDVHEDDPSRYVVTMRVLARFQGQNMPFDSIPTDWQLNWWEMPDGKWMLKDVTPMGGANLNGGQMSKQYFSAAP
jgi:hypothetical protein